MKSIFRPQDQVVGIPINSVAYTVKRPPVGYLPKPDTQHQDSGAANDSPALKQKRANSVLQKMNRLGKKADNFANCVREHVRLGPKITETVKGKLSLGAKILQVGGVDKIFRQSFTVGEDEKLLNASQCYFVKQQQGLLQDSCLSLLEMCLSAVKCSDLLNIYCFRPSL